MERDAKSQSILSRYADGHRAFPDLDDEDGVYNFDNADLRDADFSGIFLLATFRHANLAGADFSRSNIKTCDFSCANLTGAKFAGSAIDAALFEGATLTNADFEGVSIQSHVFGKGELPPH